MPIESKDNTEHGRLKLHGGAWQGVTLVKQAGFLSVTWLFLGNTHSPENAKNT